MAGPSGFGGLRKGFERAVKEGGGIVPGSHPEFDKEDRTPPLPEHPPSPRQQIPSGVNRSEWAKTQAKIESQQAEVRRIRNMKEFNRNHPPGS